jgi:ATP-dependent DNA helicase RecQ
MTAQAILKQYFGYEAFRGGQEELICGILAGRDVLGIMPTGAGKSICFQVPALMMDGITLIISPLISLMKDQVSALIQAGVAAAYMNSSLTEKQLYKALQNARGGAYKLIYVAPERLLTSSFLQFASSAPISMLTIDEAHCISQWGHDFRPSYARIPEFIATLQQRPVISAFTATATPKVQSDIIDLLRLNDPSVLSTGFDRPNLYFEVRKPQDKFAELCGFLLNKKDLSGIVYCSTRAAVEEVCAKLQVRGYKAARYHAGLSDRERHGNQDDFIYDRIQIMVATNAFGMGIDKSNVAFVVHYNMPKDIESYYQEAGRAGRDGEAAECVLLYSKQDVRTNLWLIENASEAEGAENGPLREKILERDRARLREMTFYCGTSECLRGYILRYFGEKAPAHCGQCGSCGTDFDTVDITVLAQKILSCVARMGERYGAKMVIDTLRGSKSEKIHRFGLDKLPTYGICEQSARQLSAVMEYLVLSGYLIKTDDKYPLVKLGGRAQEVLRGKAAVQMKLPKERATAQTKTPHQPLNRRLFAALREIRAAIAEEQNLPAFVVFHDSTLTDMCLKTPTTPESFLDVSGVGEVKAKRYGTRFLEAISKFLKDNPPGESTEEAPRDFDPMLIEITDEPVTVSALADRINCGLIAGGYEKISGRRINDWLIANGYLTLSTESGVNFKVPTPQGEALGITNEERLIRGVPAKINLFGRPAQEHILVHNFAIVQEKLTLY